VSDPAGPDGGAGALFSVGRDERPACTVCAQSVESGASAICGECAEPFHLVMTQDEAGKNCGEVWLSEEFLALQFGCARCLAAARGAPPPSAPPAAPMEEASGGRVRHEGRSARQIVRRRRR
jgi:hypothetical protein